MAGTKITVAHNGPIRVEGDFEVLDPEGKAFSFPGRTVVAFCRCGHSAHYKELRSKTVLTVLGPVQLRRPYYTCADCAKSTLDIFIGLLQQPFT